MLKVLLSREVIYNIECGTAPHAACLNAISKMDEQTRGKGGVICLDKFGKVGVAFNTRAMAWASITGSHILKYGIDPGEEITGEM